jgi:predicted NBD/HSP70 family sugar kinase
MSQPRTEALSSPLTPPQGAVLQALAEHGPLTRPELADLIDFSSPTVIHAIAELEAAGMVDNVETRQGARGRSALVYGLGRRSGWILGIDYGTSHVEFVAIDLSGATLESKRIPIDNEGRHPMAFDDEMRSELARYRALCTRRHGSLRRVGLAVPTIVPADQRLHPFSGGGDGDPAAPPLAHERTGAGPSFDLGSLVDALALPDALEVVLENNINCSAYAEARRLDGDETDLLYLHLGQGGAGLGIVVGGQLLRGRTGSAGELRWFPFPFSPGGQIGFALEEHFGARGFLDRARSDLGTDSGAPRTVGEVFDRAEAGDPAARAFIADFAHEVALALTGFVAVVDPALGVLGGGLGSRPLLVDDVRHALRSIGREIPLSSDPGETSSAIGAGLLALDRERKQLGLAAGA